MAFKHLVLCMSLLSFCVGVCPLPTPTTPLTVATPTPSTSSLPRTPSPKPKTSSTTPLTTTLHYVPETIAPEELANRIKRDPRDFYVLEGEPFVLTSDHSTELAKFNYTWTLNGTIVATWQKDKGWNHSHGIYQQGNALTHDLKVTVAVFNVSVGDYLGSADGYANVHYKVAIKPRMAVTIEAHRLGHDWPCFVRVTCVVDDRHFNDNYTCTKGAVLCQLVHSGHTALSSIDPPTGVSVVAEGLTFTCYANNGAYTEVQKVTIEDICPGYLVHESHDLLLSFGVILTVLLALCVAVAVYWYLRLLPFRRVRYRSLDEGDDVAPEKLTGRDTVYYTAASEHITMGDAHSVPTEGSSSPDSTTAAAAVAGCSTWSPDRTGRNTMSYKVVALVHAKNQ